MGKDDGWGWMDRQGWIDMMDKHGWTGKDDGWGWMDGQGWMYIMDKQWMDGQ